MKFLSLIAVLSLALSAQGAIRPSDNYAPGDTVQFSISRQGKAIGSETAVCLGKQWVEATQETLYVFSMETNSVLEHGGRALDTKFTSKACYLGNGLPRYYEYTLKLMNATVSQYGTFSPQGYSGVTTRFGVREPFNLPLKKWPILFDNSFAMQWELAMYLLNLPPGDSASTNAVIPQLNQMMPVRIISRPNQVMRFEGENVSVKVLDLVDLNQVLYIAQDGKLLRAVDPKQNIVVQRVKTGTVAQVERPSFWGTIENRAGPYALLLLFSLACAAILGWRHELRFDALALFIVGALLYWGSLKLLEPLQQAYFSFTINPQSPSSNIYMTLLGSALLFAIVEQIAILIPTLIAFLLPYKKRLAVCIAIGAACGAGFGLMQAINLTGFTASGAAVSGQLLVQKLGLIGISAGCGAFFGLFLGGKAGFWFYLIPVGIKGLQNWLAAFVQKGSLSEGEYIVVTLLVAGLTLFLFYWLRFTRFAVDKKRR